MTDEKREQLRAAYIAMLDAHTALWDRQRDFENALGHDVESISDGYDGGLLDWKEGDTIEDEDLDFFLEYCAEHRDGEDHK